MNQAPLPVEFTERIRDILPDAQSFSFAPKAFQTFRINTLKIALEEAWDWLLKQNIKFQRIEACPYAFTVERTVGRELLASTPAAQGLFYAQGLESMLPVMALDPKPGERVLDLCAAPGSKTSQIAMHMNNQGFLKANEPVRERLYRLKSVLQLTGAKAQVTSTDGRRLKEHGELYDRILVDAPCSCEGRFVVNDAKSFGYWSVRKIKEMSHKQKGLLLNASRMLKNGGVMVYATCTFAPEENEEVIDWFMRKAESPFELIPVEWSGIKTYPCLGNWQKRSFHPRISVAARISPDERMEGFFIAKFKKSIYN